MDNLEEFVCSKCGSKMEKLYYSNTGFGVTPEAFTWNARKSLRDPNSPLRKFLDSQNKQG